MIFLDSNLFVIDLRYSGDVHHRVNHRALDRLGVEGVGMTSVLNLLDVCGILSWNARHFVGKLPVPALTPGEWLRHRTR